MDRDATLATLTGMFQHITEAAAHFDVALTRATVVDNTGRAPITPGWVETFDEWIAAAEVAELLELHATMNPTQTLEQFSSENSRFVFSGQAAPSWASVAVSLRARSPLFAGTSAGVTMVPVASGSAPLRPRSETRRR